MFALRNNDNPIKHEMRFVLYFLPADVVIQCPPWPSLSPAACICIGDFGTKSSPDLVDNIVLNEGK